MLKYSIFLWWPLNMETDQQPLSLPLLWYLSDEIRSFNEASIGCSKNITLETGHVQCVNIQMSNWNHICIWDLKTKLLFTRSTLQHRLGNQEEWAESENAACKLSPIPLITHTLESSKSRQVQREVVDVIFNKMPAFRFLKTLFSYEHTSYLLYPDVFIQFPIRIFV